MKKNNIEKMTKIAYIQIKESIYCLKNGEAARATSLQNSSTKIIEQVIKFYEKAIQKQIQKNTEIITSIKKSQKY